jgi:two-component system, OmpR family, phosphate regulon response regulator PhoB
MTTDHLKDKRILVIDDEEFMLWAIKIKLEKCGAKAITSGNVHDAFFKLNNVKPDLILLDIMLPDMSGLEFMSLIKNNFMDTKIPVILMSTLSKDEVINVGYKLGATDYIIKPFDMGDLVEKIAQVLAPKVH